MKVFRAHDYPSSEYSQVKSLKRRVNALLAEIRELKDFIKYNHVKARGKNG